jgi:hypothetical protein
MLQRVYSLLESCTTDLPLFPPTLLYNEGWLLRLILDWFSNQQIPAHPLNFSPTASWFSEALLPSAFLARKRDDSLAESRTHADGVIGHFAVGQTGKADLVLQPKATQLVVLEAKISSGLSSKTKNIHYFDQAARNVACIAEVLNRAKRNPADLDRLGFCVLAPHAKIASGVFSSQLDRVAIVQKVEHRVRDYAGDKDQWYADWFLPALERIDVRALSWEEIMATIGERDPSTAGSLEEFYGKCLKFN